MWSLAWARGSTCWHGRKGPCVRGCSSLGQPGLLPHSAGAPTPHFRAVLPRGDPRTPAPGPQLLLQSTRQTQHSHQAQGGEGVRGGSPLRPARHACPEHPHTHLTQVSGKKGGKNPGGAQPRITPRAGTQWTGSPQPLLGPRGRQEGPGARGGWGGTGPRGLRGQAAAGGLSVYSIMNAFVSFVRFKYKQSKITFSQATVAVSR